MNSFTPKENALIDKEMVYHHAVNYEVTESFDLAAESLPASIDPSVPLSKSDMAKLRKRYVTIQHPIAKSCGHKLDLSRQPRHRNCDNCWANWLNSNGPTVQTAEELIAAGNEKLIIALQGPKFLHNVKKFLSTVALMQAQMENVNE